MTQPTISVVANQTQPSVVATWTMDPFNVAQDTTLLLIARGARGGHTTAAHWAIADNQCVTWTVLDTETDPVPGSGYGRAVVIATRPAGPFPITGLAPTLDAWATSDVGAYQAAVVQVTHPGSPLVSHGPAYDQEASVGTVNPALGQAVTDLVIGVVFGEDNVGSYTWTTPAGYTQLSHYDDGYYGVQVVTASADADGTVALGWTGDPQYAGGVLLTLGPSIVYGRHPLRRRPWGGLQ